MLVRIANRKDADQTASLSSLIWVCPVCLSLLTQAPSVWNFRTFTVVQERRQQAIFQDVHHGGYIGCDIII